MTASTIMRTSRDRDVVGPFRDVSEIEKANADAGMHYFEASTMRFFRSRIGSDVIAGRFFITSEQSDWNAPRLYSVREAMPDGSIDTLGEFQEHGSSAQAKRAARRAAGELHAYYFDGQHGKGGRKVVYVVTARDPWHALTALRSNFRVQHCGRAADYMLPGGQHADHYVRLAAK